MTRSKSIQKRLKASGAPIPEIEKMVDAFLSPETPTSFESPESSNIWGAAYNPDTRQLRVSFKSVHVGVITYTYEAFPTDLWEEFVTAASKGGFFASAIRPFYPGTKVV